MAEDGDKKAATSAPAAAQPAAKPAEGQTTTVRYVDRPDCAETFADSVNNVYFDGQSLRFEFGITRLDEIKPNTPVSGRRFPAQRMVLTPGAAVMVAGEPFPLPCHRLRQRHGLRPRSRIDEKGFDSAGGFDHRIVSSCRCGGASLGEA